MGISHGLVELIKNMYSKLEACVQLEGGNSEAFKSLVGLKQGCNLSPLLFNLFINDIVQLIDTSNSEPPTLNGIPVSCLLYADDLVLISKSSKGLQNAINSLACFTKTWFLEVNPKKTKCLVFSKNFTKNS